MKKDPTNSKKVGRPLSFDRDTALEKAMLVFWQHGYETTSISDLTAAMGVTAPSIYTAFGDKKSLFLEAVNLYAGTPEAFEQTLYKSATAYEAANQILLESAKAFTGADTPRGCLLASATASGSGEAADVQSFVTSIRNNIRGLLEKRIDKDIADNLLPQATNSASLAALVIAIIQGMSVLARDGVDRDILIDLAKVSMRAWPSTGADLKTM
jgi:AcrR family transcriptional regulator